MLTHKDLPVYSFETKEEFYDWLSVNHANDSPFWLRYFKKASNIPSIVHTEAVDAALCWGWIDGLLNKFDEVSYVVRFTQRRPKSMWSKINVEKVHKLIEQGLMQPHGLKHVESAKKDGRWDRAYEPASKMKIPDDFIDRLKKIPAAYEFYKTLNKANIFAIGFRLSTTADPAKREQKIIKIIEMLEKEQKFHD